MCEPGDVGGYIKAIVRSVDESIRGEAEVIVGPIAIDVMVKRVIEGALYAGSLLSQVVLCERERKSNVTIRLGARTIEVVDEALKLKGWTRHNLAVKLGTDDAQVCRWLSPSWNITLKTIHRIEKALGQNLITIIK